jgi:hypothetical protein
MPLPAAIDEYLSFYGPLWQPLEDQVYGVTIVPGNGRPDIKYTVTVIGVDGLAFGKFSSIPRQLSPSVFGPRPAAMAAARDAAAAAPDATPIPSAPDSPEPALSAAPLMPEGWGQ